MARLTKNAIKKKTIQQMENLNVYKAEYDTVIDIYADLIYQYKIFTLEFEKNGYRVTEEYTNKAGATNQRKVPILTALETLRKDIGAYSDRLKLNPKNDDVVLSSKEDNVLDQFLNEMHKT